MRQHERDAVDATPLDFARGNELVDHHLRTVGKIAKLGFPDDQGVGVVRGIAVFKAQHRFLGQDRVDNGKGRLVVGCILQRNIGTGVPLLAVLVVNHRMAVGEGTASAVLTRQTYWKPTGYQGGKSHVLAHAPVHRQVTAPHGGAVVINLFHQGMWSDGRRNGADALGQAFPFGHGNGGISRIGPFFAQERRPVHGELGFEIAEHRVRCVFACIECCAVGLDHLVAQALAHALRSQTLSVQLARAGVGSDFFVHQGLSQAGCVLFVVAQLTKTGDIDHHILAKFHAVLQRKLRGQHHRLGVVAVDVQHGRFDHLDNVGAKHRGAHIAWVRGGETNLVIDDDVHRAACGVATGLRQRQGFLVHALAAKSSVAVHQHGQHLAALGVIAAVHARTHRPLHHRVDDL